MRRTENCKASFHGHNRSASMRIRIAASFCALFIFIGSAQAQQRPPALEVQFNRAESAWRTGASLHEAKARVDRVIRELPDDGEARKLRAQVLLALDRPEEALVDALKAVETDSTDPEARVVLCETAIAAGEPDLARRELDAAASRSLDHPALNVRLSATSIALGQLERAESFARRALELSPVSPQAHYQLARVLVRRGRNDDAIDIIGRGLQNAAIDAEAIRTDSILQILTGDPRFRELLSPN